MPTRGDVFVEGCYYHIFNRAVGSELLFVNPENYNYCIELIERYSTRYAITVVAYCLMPNHYHFLLRQETGLPVSKFINVLFNGYVQAFNRQQDRTGTLFEGRFKHRVIDKDAYLLHLCRYIHLNPFKANLVRYPEDWYYSDYLEWIGARPSTINKDLIMQGLFTSSDEYKLFVYDEMENQKQLTNIEKYLLD